MNSVKNKDHKPIIEDEKSIDLRDLWNKFLHRKSLFMYIAIPIFLGILIAQFTKPYTPIYRATFDIGISRESQVEGFFSPLRSETPITQIGTVTQRVISNLLSVSLSYKIIDTLNLYTYAKDANPGVNIETRIKQDFKEPFGPLKLKFENGGFSVNYNGDKIQQGLFNEFVDFGSFELKVIPFPEKNLQGKTYEIIIYPRDKIAIALRNSLAIKVLEADKIGQEMGSSGVPFSGEGVSKKLVTAKTIFPGMNLIGILRINVLWGNPDDALRIADVLSKQIIKEDLSEKSLQYIQSRTFIDSQLTLYRGNLTKLEDGVKGFKEQKRITDLGASTQSLISQVSDLETRKNQLQIEQKILNDMSDYLVKSEQGIDVPLNFATTLVSDPILQNFYSQLLTTEAELKGKLKEYSNGHPKVVGIKAKLDGLKEQMKEEVPKRMATIRSEIASIKTQINMLQARLENVPADEIQLARLERDRETAEKLYTFFAEKLEETRVAEAGVTSDLKIINPPLMSPNPVNSRGVFKNLAIALLIGMLTGGFAIFIAEYLDNTVKDPGMIAEKTGLPIFASIPIIEDEDGKMKKPRHRHKKAHGFVEQVCQLPVSLATRAKEIYQKPIPVKKFKILDGNVSSAEFEAFRKLSMNLEFASPEKKYRVIYITSSGPNEGKTFISANLGQVLRISNKKIIIIDTDFRKKRGNITHIAKMRKKKGLFDILKGEANLNDTIMPFKIESTSKTTNANKKQNVLHLSHHDVLTANKDKSAPNTDNAGVGIIDILPTGDIPPNPFVFLESDEMKKLVNKLSQTYDYVLIDGVPLLLFADAAFLANFVDGVLLTVKYGQIAFRELEHARDMLLASNSNIIGIVMNGVPKTREGYYYYYHYYYNKYYSKYYHGEDKQKQRQRK